MARTAAKKEMTLRWLEVFQICAQKGSLQAAANEMGLTISTVSHHLRSLENHLGIELFNHARRPLVLTPKGQVFLRGIDEALYMIRKAKAEASSGTLAEASLLRIGTIEDFDSDIIPELAVSLSSQMPGCHFTYQTDTSHTIIEMLRNRHLDLGIACAPHEHNGDLQDRPFLRDPFLVVLPRSTQHPVLDIVEGQSDLPFLRFSSDLLIARQIDSHLRRLGLMAKSNFECSNTQTLMAMVAAGAGWTITTPLLFARARRFQSNLALHAFPGKRFARTLSILATSDCSQSVLDMVDSKMRDFVSKYAISGQTRDHPWLADSFKLLG